MMFFRLLMSAGLARAGAGGSQCTVACWRSAHLTGIGTEPAGIKAGEAVVSCQSIWQLPPAVRASAVAASCTSCSGVLLLSCDTFCRRQRTVGSRLRSLINFAAWSRWFPSLTGGVHRPVVVNAARTIISHSTCSIRRVVLPDDY